MSSTLAKPWHECALRLGVRELHQPQEGVVEVALQILDVGHLRFWWTLEPFNQNGALFFSLR